MLLIFEFLLIYSKSICLKCWTLTSDIFDMSAVTAPVKFIKLYIYKLNNNNKNKLYIYQIQSKFSV